MAIKDTTKKPYMVDRDDKISDGIDLPFRKDDDGGGWFASTSTTIEAVKNNIKNLLQTQQGERLMQPFLGINLRKYLFEQIEDDTILKIQNDILDSLQLWLPFVEVRDIRVISKQLDVGGNTLGLYIVFNIKQDPNTLDSVQIDIGE